MALSKEAFTLGPPAPALPAARHFQPRTSTKGAADRGCPSALVAAATALVAAASAKRRAPDTRAVGVAVKDSLSVATTSDGALKAMTVTNEKKVRDTTVVTTVEEADHVMKILMQNKDVFHAIDTEVRGWDPAQSPYGRGEVVCFSVFLGPGVNFGSGAQLLVDNLDQDGNLRGLVEHFRPYFEDPSVKKVFQNYSFDRAILSNHGCRVAGFHADTMHMARLINSDAESVSLQALGKTHLGIDWEKRSYKKLLEQAGARSAEELHNHKDPDVRESWFDYAAFDAQVTWKLHEKFREMLSYERNRKFLRGNLLDFYEKFWRPFGEVLVDIEERGVLVDQAFLRKKIEVANADLEKANASFRDFLKDQWQRLYPGTPELMEHVESFNINSPKQMKHLLYGRGVKEIANVKVGGFGLQPVKVAKQKESTSQEAIKILAGPNPKAGQCGLAEDILGQQGCIGLNYRVEAAFVGKALSSFLEKLGNPNIVDGRGRLHTSLSLLCRTGRLTSRNPNLQQIPAVDKDRYQIRNAIIPEPGKTFVIADYGQLDLRVLAHTSGCSNLIEALRSGIDLHSHTAAQMYPHIQKAVDNGEVSLEGGDGEPCVKDLYPSERRSAKAVNFGIAYGLTAYGLARQLNCDETEAQSMIDMWYEAYPQVKVWQGQVIEEAERGPLAVQTYRGRSRHIPDLLKKPAKRRVGRELLRRTPDQGRSYWEYLSAKRQAINAPVQGGSADVVAEAMVKAAADPELNKLGYKMVLQIHDELLFEGPKDKEVEALRAVKRVMEDPFLDDYEFEVPLIVDAKIATSWHEAKHA